MSDKVYYISTCLAYFAITGTCNYSLFLYYPAPTNQQRCSKHIQACPKHVYIPTAFQDMDEPPIEIYLPPRHTNPYHRAREVRRDLLEKSNTVHYTKVLHHSATVAPAAGRRATLAAVHDSGAAAPKHCSDDVATPGQGTTVDSVDKGTHSMSRSENILFQIFILNSVMIYVSLLLYFLFSFRLFCIIESYCALSQLRMHLSA